MTDYIKTESLKDIRLPEHFPDELQEKWNTTLDEIEAATEMDVDNEEFYDKLLAERAKQWEEDLNEICRIINWKPFDIIINEANIHITFKEESDNE